MPKDCVLVKPTTEPRKSPVTLQQVKDYMRINGSQVDEELKGFIKSAVTYLENKMGRALLHKTYQCLYASNRTIRLPYMPISFIHSVTGFSDFKREKPTEIQDYKVLNDQLKIPFSGPWIEVVYTAGYTENPKDLPPDLIQAVLLTVSCLYDMRTGEVDLTPVNDLIAPYLVRHL